MKASLAHLRFVSIHPFDDGNGRIARAIADMALARSENSPQRFYSMSAQIRQDRNRYYEILERTQKGDMDVTSWMEWFLVASVARSTARKRCCPPSSPRLDSGGVRRRISINDRQRLVLNRLLDGFEGNLQPQNTRNSRSPSRILPFGI